MDYATPYPYVFCRLSDVDRGVVMCVMCKVWIRGGALEQQHQHAESAHSRRERRAPPPAPWNPAPGAGTPPRAPDAGNRTVHEPLQNMRLGVKTCINSAHAMPPPMVIVFVFSE